MSISILFSSVFLKTIKTRYHNVICFHLSLSCATIFPSCTPISIKFFIVFVHSPLFWSVNGFFPIGSHFRTACDIVIFLLRIFSLGFSFQGLLFFFLFRLSAILLQENRSNDFNTSIDVVYD